MEAAHRSADVDPAQVRAQLAECLNSLAEAAGLGPGRVLVVGVSTSEIAGRAIGTATSAELGQAVADVLRAFRERTGCEVAVQCCEHLNRALVVSRAALEAHGWTEVAAVPVPGAGGAAAAAWYFTLPDPCLAESLAADAGIDVGDTLIGMHLKRVAVPFRGARNRVGHAHVTMARTRPPLIGGARAVYDAVEARRRWQGRQE
ncbi:MAG: TIGR01440 family protein [Alicyclobacillaceae bacterium]|nr:TIGR01440 family protein [Alicyclobacillaceae bacterium]